MSENYNEFSKIIDLLRKIDINAKFKINEFVNLIKKIYSSDYECELFIKNPHNYIHNHNKKLLNAMQQLDDLSDSQIKEIRNQKLLKDINEGILKIFLKKYEYQKALTISIMLAYINISILFPMKANLANFKMNKLNHKRKISKNNEKKHDEILILDEKDFLKTKKIIFLNQLAKDIYDNPVVAKSFREDPEAYLKKIGLKNFEPDFDDFEIQFAMLFSDEEIRMAASQKDVENFFKLVNQRFKNKQRLQARSAAAVVVALALVAVYVGFAAANWVTVGISLETVLGVHHYFAAWSKVKGGSGCFLADTLVNIHEDKYIPIQLLKIGDSILSFDERKKKIKKNKIVEFFEGETRDYYILNDKIRVTSEHPFYIEGKWKKTKELKVGDCFYNIYGEKEQIFSIEKVNKKSKIYNITVENTHTYFVENILVHNKPKPEEPVSPAEIYAESFIQILPKNEQIALHLASVYGGEDFQKEILNEMLSKYLEKIKTDSNNKQEHLIAMLEKVLKQEMPDENV
ncbi:MAG: hypothetical protein Kow00108_05610 [Calditrichia bacterium]